MKKQEMTKRIEMPEQEPQIRKNNFKEVSLGYTAEMAKAEAERCLGCKKQPCVNCCPVGVPIPQFIAKVQQGQFSEAYELIKATNALPAVCGRVCPQENQCEGQCIRGKKGESVGIGRLERFCADYALSHPDDIKPMEIPAPNGKKIAVIGSGPGSLTVAGDLIRFGYQVTIFEALHEAGGVLTYGIPEFRLPKDLVKTEIKTLLDAGVKLNLDTVIGKTITLAELQSEYGFNAIYIGTGAGLPRFMGIDGENLNGVYSANEFLTRTNLMKAYTFPQTDTPIKVGKRVAVIGGGNVAMDAARCALRLGAEEVSIIYRRSEAEMPARAEEIHHAKEEGVIFRNLTNPIAVSGNEDGWVTALKCVEMELGDADESGRRSPKVKPNSEFELPLETVIIAIGNSPNPLIAAATPGLKVNKWGCLEADKETGETSLTGVYAGGDAVTGAATVILAMGAGKKAAAAIDEYLKTSEPIVKP